VSDYADPIKMSDNLGVAIGMVDWLPLVNLLGSKQRLICRIS